MRSLLSLLSLLSLVGAARAEEVVDWRDAARCVGRVCSIAGTVTEQTPDGPVFRLYFDPQRRDVYVTLVRAWLITWPSYAGQRIVATGPVDRFRDQVEMIVTSPASIALPDATPALTPPPVAEVATPTPVPPSPTAGSAAPDAAAPTASAAPATATPVPPSATVPPPTPGEVERLRDRVRELEERVRELESR